MTNNKDKLPLPAYCHAKIIGREYERSTRYLLVLELDKGSWFVGMFYTLNSAIKWVEDWVKYNFRYDWNAITISILLDPIYCIEANGFFTTHDGLVKGKCGVLFDYSKCIGTFDSLKEAILFTEDCVRFRYMHRRSLRIKNQHELQKTFEKYKANEHALPDASEVARVEPPVIHKRSEGLHRAVPYGYFTVLCDYSNRQNRYLLMFTGKNNRTHLGSYDTFEDAFDVAEANRDSGYFGESTLTTGIRIQTKDYDIREGWFTTSNGLFSGRFGVFLYYYGCVAAFNTWWEAAQFMVDCDRYGLHEGNQRKQQAIFAKRKKRKARKINDSLSCK